MAPSRTSTVKSKHAVNKSGIRNSKNNVKSPGDGVSKPKKRTEKSGGPPRSGPAKKKRRRVYTEKELGVPTLNMITPVGVEKPKGRKKGKIFVDDRESMMTILAMVNADKDGQIESKMMKARQMEEIREARKAEAEKRIEMRKSKLDDAKDSMRKKRKRGGEKEEKDNTMKTTAAGTRPLKVKKKTVSFAQRTID